MQFTTIISMSFILLFVIGGFIFFLLKAISKSSDKNQEKFD